MVEVVVTRNHQVTLTKEIREKLDIHVGDRVVINTLGDAAMITKRDPTVWRSVEPFLPEDFEDVLEKMRADPSDRLARLGIT